MSARTAARQERAARQHALRVQWEEERTAREAEKTGLESEYRRQLGAKRRQESARSEARLQQARALFLRSQVALVLTLLTALLCHWKLVLTNKL